MRLLAATLAVLLALPTAAEPACRAGFTCPGRAGRVDVTLAGFDGSGTSSRAGVLDADEIQCALDCLDGDADPDHLMPGPEAPFTATPVMGGVIAFDPTASYKVQRSLELPAAARGAVRIEGNGAKLAIDGSGAPVTLLERRAPKGANNCDVESMSVWSVLWSIEGLQLAGRGLPDDEGIVVHGSKGLRIEGCLFGSLGTGIDLRFALSPLVQRCSFTNCRRHDVMLGPGNEECDPDGACFTPCTNGPAVFTKAGCTTKLLVESGCNSAVLSRTTHFMGSEAPSSIRIINSAQVVLEGPVFDGFRTRHAVHHSCRVANSLVIRDMYYETGVPSQDAVIVFDGGSRLAIDGLHLVTGAEQPLVDVSGNSGCTVDVSRVPWCPPGMRFMNGTNAWRNQWRFADVAAQDLASADRWAGGPPPRSLQIVTPTSSLAAGQETSLALQVPVGDPVSHGVKLQPGQVWLDSKTHRLMYCCGRDGRPMTAGR